MNEPVKLDKKNIESVLPLTPMQEGILFHYLKNPAGAEYVEQLRIILEGTVAFDEFQLAWRIVVGQNQALRTVFRWEKLDRPIQVVLKEHEGPVVYYDDSTAAGEPDVRFDLRKVPFRVVLRRIATNRFEMKVFHHHILYDGWSNGVLLREFFSVFSTLCRGDIPLLKTKNSFSHYIDYLEKSDKTAASGFWSRYLSGFQRSGGLPFAYKEAPCDCGQKFDSIVFRLDPGVLESLETLARRERVTLASVYYGAWGMLLQRYLNCPDVLIGTAVSGRSANIAGIDNMTGLFINTLPLRVREFAGDSVMDFLGRLDSQSRERNRYDYSSLVEIKAAIGWMVGEDLFDTLVVVENYPLDVDGLTGVGPARVLSVEDSGSSNFDLALSTGGILGDTFRMKYREGRFTPAEARRIAGHFETLLTLFAAAPERDLSTLEILSEPEKQTILTMCNHNPEPRGMRRNLIELFCNQAEKTPNRKAVEGPSLSSGPGYPDIQLTFAQLNALVDRLAGELCRRGRMDGTLVAVMMERSVELVAALLAILRAGGAYLPLTPDIPSHRLTFIVKDSAVQTVITQNWGANPIGWTLVELFGDRRVFADKLDRRAKGTRTLPLSGDPDDPAYLIYTSGSTGRPKGVVARHESVALLIRAQQNKFAVTCHDRILHFSAVTFDASVAQIFLPLLTGASLVVVSRDLILDSGNFWPFVARRQITHLHAVPSFLSNLSGDVPACVSRILTGGDVCPTSLARKFFKRCRFFNRYGPTEGTVTALEHLVTDVGPAAAKIPIGKPLDYVGIYILDFRRRLSPVGAVGELYISGSGLAFGYLNDPESTSERFMTVPGITCSPLYRTGDLGRWNSDGTVDFIGRVDRQVKIRGYRIELGDIEAHLTDVEGIREAAVLVDMTPNGDASLRGYYVADTPIPERELASFLEGRLPGYMIPAGFSHLETMPLSSSGKLDRSQLPQVDYTIENRDQAPRDFVEEMLVDIWADILALPASAVGVNRSFFKMGGHSLSVASLMGKIYQRLGKQISFEQFFKTPTVRGIAHYLQVSGAEGFGAIEAVEKKEYFPLTGQQRRLYALYELDRESTAYNLPFAARLDGAVDLHRFQDAFRHLIRRHESLRTCYRMLDREPVQLVQRDVDFVVRVMDETPADDIEGAIDSFCRPFDLERAPLFRVEARTLGETAFLLLMDIHHIVADGLSLGILFDQLIALYNGEALPAPTTTYQDYQLWSHLRRADNSFEPQALYWKQELAGDLPVLDLPVDFQRESRLDFVGRSLRFTIDRRMTEGLKDLATNRGTTLYMVLLAMYYVLLSYLADQEEIIVGTPVSGRRHSDLQLVVGMFVNTVAMRGKPLGEKRFTQFLAEVKDKTIGGLENQDIPFDQILLQNNVPRHAGRNPLFDCLFSFFEGIAGTLTGRRDMEGVAITPIQYKPHSAKFDLSLFVEAAEEDLEMSFEYRTSLFTESTVQCFRDCFLTMTANVLAEPSRRIASIEGVSRRDKERILEMCSGGLSSGPSDTLHDMFARQAEKTPDIIALIYKQQKLTYGELLSQSWRIAGMLKERGVAAGDIVAIVSGRSPAMVAGLFGVLMAGAAYLPIDPDFPEARVQYMVKDAAARLILTGESGLEPSPAGTSAANPSTIGHNDEFSAAYIIYTSGSTGNPKGVMVDHRAIANRLRWGQETFPLRNFDVILQKTPYIFDVSVWELFWWPLAGASLCLLPHGDEANPSVIVETVLKERVSVIHFIPSMLSAFLDYIVEDAGAFVMPPLVFASGEALGVKDVEQFFRLIPSSKTSRLINLYGPTEAAVEASWYECGETAGGSIPIGKPISNMALMVVDKQMRLKPLGIKGELCLAGVGLARGYVNRPDVTARAFVPHEWTQLPGEDMRVYRTGDRCRQLPDGNMEYLGRLDHQVKIRGHRIELGEIENRLNSNPDVGRAAVVIRRAPHGDLCLCAFIEPVGACASDGRRETLSDRLKDYLTASLPGYMIPDVFRIMERLPLTASGKLDRNSLPAEVFKETGGDGSSLREGNEALLAEIWLDVLGLENVGPDDHFFGIGGDSIKAIQVVSRLRKKNIRIGVEDIANFPTIRTLSRLAAPADQSSGGETATGDFDLAPIQRWFFQAHDRGLHHFNQAVALLRTSGFSRELVEEVLARLTRHHDALRMTFSRVGARWTQRYGDPAGNWCPLEVEHLSATEDWKEFLHNESFRFHGAFDLESGHLMRCVLLKRPAGDILVFIAHHLLVDGVSWRILLEDFSEGYTRLDGGLEFRLPAKTASYASWIQQLSVYALSDELLGQTPYWQEMQNHPLQRIPRENDITENELIYEHIDTLEALLTEVDTAQLAADGRRAYNTGSQEILLAALGMAVNGWCGIETFAVGLEGHGRENMAGNLDLSRTIGWFTSRYPLVVSAGLRDDAPTVLRRIKALMKQLPQRGAGYGVLRYVSPLDERGTRPLILEPEITFNYHGDAAAGFEGDDIAPVGFGDDCGKRIHPQLRQTVPLDVNIISQHGRFKVSLSYNRLEFSLAEIRKLLELFRLNVLKLSEHCGSMGDAVPVPDEVVFFTLPPEIYNQVAVAVGNRDSIQAIYPLTPMQQGILFHVLEHSAPELYSVQTEFVIRGHLDPAALQTGLNRIVRRHEGLRGQVIFRDVDVPCLAILNAMPVEVHVEDLTSMAAGSPDVFLEDFKRLDRSRGFQMAGEPLFRISLLRMSANSFRLIWTFHHILMDGWCMGIVFKELIQFFSHSFPAPPPRLQEYFHWMTRQDRQEGLRFWNSYLQGFDEPTGFQGLKPKRTATGTLSYNFAIDPATSRGLAQLAKKHRVTLNAIFQGLWGLLLQSVNNTDDVVFGTVVSGRPGEIEDVENLVGLFINTVPVRVKRRPAEDFMRLVARQHSDGVNTRRFEHVPLVDIMSQSQLQGNLFDHLMVFENYPISNEINGALSGQSTGFSVENIDSSTRTNYDFLVVVSGERSLHVSIEADASIVDEDFLPMAAGRIRHLAHEVSAKPEQALEELELLPVREREMLLERLTKPALETSNDTICSVWRRQAALTPHRLAVAGPSLNRAFKGMEVQLTYSRLGEEVDRLSLLSRERGVGPGTIVAMLLERSVDMIVAILAILDAGGGYLPMDPELPARRRDLLFRQSGASMWIAQHALLDTEDAAIFMDDPLWGDTQPEEVGREISQASDLAYIIFTSGSTGTPKGVMVEHHSVVNLIASQTKTFGIDQSERIMQFSSIGFDASVEQIFLALFNGGTLVLAAKERILDGNVFAAFLASRAVTHLHTVPSFLQQLTLNSNLCLRRVIAGGDECPVALAERFSGVSDFFNEYGPTETTVTSVECKVEPYHLESPKLPIGRGLTNTELYVLDRKLRLTPMGAAGELYIGGRGVARGYLNQPELTAGTFIDNPFNPHSRLYRTGDLVRWLPDGSLEFLGRLDQQVKIRGYRIECGEIEWALNRCAGIDESLVTVKQDTIGDKYLCAYYVADGAHRPREFRSALRNVLPEYMVPSVFLPIPRIPLNENGKIDRRHLPEPRDLDTSVEDFIPLSSATEKRLAGIWQEILDRQVIGATDHFFEIGGHSLKAMVLASRIQKEFHKELPLKQIFSSPTLREMAENIDAMSEAHLPPIPRAEKRDSYPASSAQKRMYMLNGWDGAGGAYHISSFWEIGGEVDKDRVAAVFEEIVARHDSLRTSFVLSRTIEQTVHPAVSFALEYIDLPEPPAGKLEEDRLARELAKRFNAPFDLGAPPLMRAGLVRLGTRRYWLIITMHHIISDGVSNGLITGEFHRLYMKERLQPLSLQYCDFSQWQHHRLKTGALDRQKEYWLDVLSNEIPVLNLPEDFPRPAVQSFAGHTVKKSLDRDLSRQLRAMAQKHDATLFMVLLAGYSILLARFSGQEDIVVGTAVAGRPHSDLNHVVGLFVNTLALRFFPEEIRRLDHYVAEARDVAIAAFENQHYPFEELIEQLDLPRDPGRNPLFDTLFVRQSETEGNARIPGLEVQPLRAYNQTSKFDLSILANDDGEQIEFTLEYCTDLFTAATIHHLWKHYRQLLRQMTVRPEAAIGSLESMDAEERRMVMRQFNCTDCPFPQESVHALFSRRARRSPDVLALAQGERQVSYSELERRSGMVAAFLDNNRRRGHDIVGIMGQRGIEAVIGLLGILKSGRAYLPIDPSYPEDRIHEMIQDSRVEFLLTAGDVPPIEAECFKLEEMAAGSAIESKTAAAKAVQLSSLAYILYTSGSEGRPKGVMVEHRSIVRLVCNTNFIEFKEDDRILQTGALEFDASTFEIWGSLLNGLVLCLVDRETILSAAELKEAINRYRVRTIWLTAPLFNQLLDTDATLFKNLRNLIAGGDALSVPHINRLVALYPHLTVLNGYGPTENTTFSTTFHIQRLFGKNIPIGGPIANSTCHVLNRSGTLLGIGMAGELCVGGEGVSRGYLNDPDLTAQKFFQSEELAGRRLYRTGDLVRWSVDGSLEYLGRIDQQVKIRGNRVEIGEIEQRLLDLDCIKDAVVVSREWQGQRDLLAYVVPADIGAELEGDTIRDYLYECLPGYMVPSFFIQLDNIPLTKNGKVDRKRLPAPAPSLDNRRSLPHGQWQRRLSPIWADTLGIPHTEPDIDENFFSLGGHSLKATLLVGKIHKEFNVKIRTVDVFRRPSIRLLAKFLQQANHQEFQSIQPVEKSEYYPLSPAQNRLHVLHRMGEGDTAYNVPSVFKISGALDARTLEATFKSMIQRHEVLRTYFAENGGKPVQIVSPAVDFLMERCQLPPLEEDEAIDRMIAGFIRPFDIGRPPLFRACLASWDRENHLLMVDMHHIICDGVSYRLFVGDLASLYSGGDLPELNLQYKDYASWQSRRLSGQALQEQERYWLDTFSGPVPALDFPTDYPRPAVQDYEGGRLEFEIPPLLLEQLKRTAGATGTTLNIVLLCAFTILLSRYTGCEDLVVGMPSAGRTHADLELLIGMFVNMLPVRCRPCGEKRFDHYLQEVKSATLEAFENQDYPFDALVDRLGLQRDAGRFPLFDVSFQLGHRDSGLVKDSATINGIGGDIVVEPFQNHNTRRTKLDLVLEGIEVGDRISMVQEYATALFSPLTIQRLVRRYLTILFQIGSNVNVRLDAIEIDHGLGLADGISDADDMSDFNFPAGLRA
jgi:amino acid adenylation domain-containing protein/non-ribosomal peptide synthase protein (TIGR01720 family)